MNPRKKRKAGESANTSFHKNTLFPSRRNHDMDEKEDIAGNGQKIILAERNGQYLLMADAPPIENIVFKGGGARGAAYAGVVRAIEEKGILETVKRVGGTSAGSMTAFSIALGYSSDQFLEISSGINFSDITGEFWDTVLDHALFGALDTMKPLSPRAARGVDSGFYMPSNAISVFQGMITDRIMQIRKKHLSENDPLHFARLFPNIEDKIRIASLAGKNPVITFSDLHYLQCAYPDEHLRDLFIVATDVASKCPRVFGYETDPDMEIALAVYASMSVPKIFQPIRYEGREYHDGGTTSNFPMEIFDGDRYIPPLYPFSSVTAENKLDASCVSLTTLGFSISGQEELNKLFVNQNSSSSDTVPEKFRKNIYWPLLGNAIAQGINYNENWQLEHNQHVVKYPQRIVPVDDCNVASFSELTEDARQRLITSGYEAATSWIDNHADEHIFIGSGDNITLLIEDLDYHQLVSLINLIDNHQLEFDFESPLQESEKIAFTEALYDACKVYSLIRYPVPMQTSDTLSLIKELLAEELKKKSINYIMIRSNLDLITEVGSKLKRAMSPDNPSDVHKVQNEIFSFAFPILMSTLLSMDHQINSRIFPVIHSIIQTDLLYRIDCLTEQLKEAGELTRSVKREMDTLRNILASPVEDAETLKSVLEKTGLQLLHFKPCATPAAVEAEERLINGVTEYTSYLNEKFPLHPRSAQTPGV